MKEVQIKLLESETVECKKLSSLNTFSSQNVLFLFYYSFTFDLFSDLFFHQGDITYLGKLLANLLAVT